MAASPSHHVRKSWHSTQSQNSNSKLKQTTTSKSPNLPTHQTQAQDINFFATFPINHNGTNSGKASTALLFGRRAPSSMHGF